MKKTMMMKSILAATMLLGAVVGQGSVSHAAGTSPAATAAPVMRDNLAKYGLKKDIELPVTVTAGGLSYTLEKIMIYDTKSATAQGLIKKYDYTIPENSKYFIWTKIKVENKSGKTVQKSYKDLSEKWSLNFGGENDARVVMPEASYYKPNNTDAVWEWSIASGKTLSTYQAFTYNENLKSFYVSINNKGNQNFVEIVKDLGQ